MSFAFLPVAASACQRAAGASGPPAESGHTTCVASRQAYGTGIRARETTSRVSGFFG